MTLQITQTAITRWHEMLETRDMSILNELLADDVVFRSPVAFHPYPGNRLYFYLDQCDSGL